MNAYDEYAQKPNIKQALIDVCNTSSDKSEEGDTTDFQTIAEAPVNAIIEKIEEIVQKSFYGVDSYKGKGVWFNPYLILFDVDNSIIPTRADLTDYLGASLENAISYNCAEFFEGIELANINWVAVAEEYFDIDAIAKDMGIE